VEISDKMKKTLGNQIIDLGIENSSGNKKSGNKLSKEPKKSILKKNSITKENSVINF
jgi:hypothetical protein